jgi:ribosomal peptide maturation radical SAM protein 1
MPFGPLFQPSIGLGLLKGALSAQQIPSKILYFTLKFAKLIGETSYTYISNGQPATFDLVGEWIFNCGLFKADELNDEGYIEDILYEQASAHRKRSINADTLSRDALVRGVLDARKTVEPFLDSCLEEILRYHPRIVAFTSVFQQQVAALSLAKRIKAHAPEIFVLIGGANCEGIMGVEVVRQFPYVDATISGEGDVIFPQLIRNILEKKPVVGLQGVTVRSEADLKLISSQFPNAPSITNMDELPFPDYDDFFEQLEISQFNLDGSCRPRLLFETSRGCWWGEKNHCTFCGLNGLTINYRSKSAQRAMDELIYLNNKYPNCSVSVVDNILDMKYFKDFVPSLAEQKLDLELFYEVKSNLRKEQVRLLHDAGITAIQPGIESLSTNVLTLMRKGVSSLQNVQLLKWCQELGVQPFWNMLWGFPGEPSTEYDRVASFIPFLVHLPPPQSAATIRLDRFSPNFNHANSLGFTNVKPYPSYYYIYPLPDNVVANLAYYFTFNYKEPQDVTSYTNYVAEQIANWQKIHENSALFSVDKDTHLLIWDLRPVSSKFLTVLTGIQKSLYIACDRIQTINQLKSIVQENGGSELEVESLETFLEPLLTKGLMLREGDSYLSLAIPLGNYSPTKIILELFHKEINTLGKDVEGKVIISTD